MSGADDSRGGVTRSVGGSAARPPPGSVRSFHLSVVEGPGAGVSWQSSGDRCSIGSHPSNDLVIEDPTVSRFHCDIELTAAGALLIDRNSRNGTVVDGVSVLKAFLRGGSLLRIGTSVVRFQFGASRNQLRISAATCFGSLIGHSPAMRTRFAQLELAARSDATVLLEGETGTGKEGAAFSLHQAGPRAAGSFVVVDCGAIPAELLESELFGHERGAFTGAETRRIGAFDEAAGGTIFLDEIGELPADLQPKLLRVLETRQVRRLGTNDYRAVDVRVIAATNRDLRAEVNEGRFRSDLYYRLAVVRISIPPLRERPEDIGPLAAHLLAELGAEPAVIDRFQDPEFLARLRGGAWPGNVRELRNYLERCLVFEEPQPMSGPMAARRAPEVDTQLTYAEARKRVLREFERHYVDALVKAHDGNVSAAARAAEVDRAYLYRLMRRSRE